MPPASTRQRPGSGKRKSPSSRSSHFGCAAAGRAFPRASDAYDKLVAMPTIKVFVAGAGGVIGRRLVPLLLQRGFDVFGTTRSAEHAGALERAGAKPVVFDVFDREAVARAVEATRPQVIIHQMTDLSGGFAPDRIAE